MKTSEKIYRELQIHLDQQPVGFPATRSGAEIRVLKHIFSPEEAGIAKCLSYRPADLETIFQKARDLVDSQDKLSCMLDTMEKKGGIEQREKEGKRYYCTSPLVVGMYEFQLGRLSPEFISDFGEYTSSMKFGIEFLSTELPQMRTIPVEKSIRLENHVSVFDEVITLLKDAAGPFAVFGCICRRKKKLEGTPCPATDREETCMAVGDLARAAVRIGQGREIGLDEAISILKKNQKDGLVLQPSNTKKADFICSCCGCCCGMLRIHKSLPIPVDFWSSNFYARVDTTYCNGCGVCEKRCQTNAIEVMKQKQTSSGGVSGEELKFASINLNRCIGCGLCVATCPKKAMVLKGKEERVTPPASRDELYDLIMAEKKGTLQKLKVTGKLIKDAVVTGQTGLFKSGVKV